MKLLTTALLLSATVLAAPALAQAPSATGTAPATGTTPPAGSSTTTEPGAGSNGTAPSTTSDAMTPSAGATDQEASAVNTSDTAQQNQGGFYTYQQGNQMLGSGLMGARVVGAGDENIGEVDDLLLDRNGQVMAVVVGVGGFLGLGEKDVAIANDQLDFVLSQTAAGGTAATPGGTTGASTATPSATTTAASSTGAAGTTTGAAPATPSATGTVATPGTTPMGTTPMASSTGTTTGMRPGMMGYGWNWTGAGIDHIQVAFTREQLEAAPAFEAAD